MFQRKRNRTVASEGVEPGNPSHERLFGSWGEFLEVCATVPNDSDSSAWLGDYEFTNTKSFPEACKLAIEGWPEGLAHAAKFADSLYDRLANSLKIDEYYYDVTGQDFDLDRVLIGEPECWLQTEQVEVKAPAQQNVKIQVNLMCSGSVDSAVLIQRGAAIAALVMLLERARRRVEVELVGPNGYLDGWWSNVKITAKHAGDDLDMAKVVFAIAHPSTFRRLYFGLLEVSGKEVRDALKAYRWAGYGHCIDLPTNQRNGDIYSPMAMGTEPQWKTEAGAIEWLTEQLAKQGVELKEGVS